MIVFQNGMNEWQLIFWIGASVYIGSGIMFCLFGSGQTQDWNYVEGKTLPNEGLENPAFESANEITEHNTKV